jgi:hypothetical protein
MQWIGQGAQTGTLQDIAPTCKKVTLSGATITRIANGKALEG